MVFGVTLFSLKKELRQILSATHGIEGLDLINLHVSDNNKIKNVSFMKNLYSLYAGNNCGIDQNGIKNLDLVELDASDNNKIKNVSFMKNLVILHGGNHLIKQ